MTNSADVASASRIRQGRSRFRARRRRMADRDQWRALSRFHLRRRGQCARPLRIRIWSRRCRSRPPSSGTCRICSRARTASGSRHGCASRASPMSCSSPIPAPRRWNARSRWRATITPPRAIRSAIASSPSRARSTAARWRRSRPPARQNISKVLVRRWTASTRSPLGDLDAVKKAIGPQTAGILIEPVQGEGGVRAGAACLLQGAARAVRRQRPAAGVRRGADRHGPHRRSVRLQAPRRHARHHVAGESARRRLSDRRVPGDRGSRLPA